MIISSRKKVEQICNEKPCKTSNVEESETLENADLHFHIKKQDWNCMKDANPQPSYDGKIMKTLKQKQPQTDEELMKSTGGDKTTIRRRTAVLEKMGLIKNILGGWAELDYNPLEETVREAMEQLREWGNQEQSSVEIANMINQLNPDLKGTNPEEVASIAWRLSSKLNISINEDKPYVRPRKRIH